MADNYRAEVIGSLLRPEYLKQACKRWEANEISTREFKQAEDRAVDEMITLQQDCDLDLITHGEMRRTHFIVPLTDVISGIKPIPAFARVFIIQQDTRELAALGCEYVQIDAPELGMLCDLDRRRQDFARSRYQPR